MKNTGNDITLHLKFCEASNFRRSCHTGKQSSKSKQGKHEMMSALLVQYGMVEHAFYIHRTECLKHGLVTLAQR